MTVEQDIESLQYIVNNANTYIIPIPDLFKTPYVMYSTTLGSKQYYLEYYWNDRTELAYLSIYKIENGFVQYLIKNISLIPDIFVSDNIHDIEWQGFLKFTQKDGITDVSYGLSDISEKFQLIYSYLED